MPAPALGTTQLTRTCEATPVNATVGLAGASGGPGVIGAETRLVTEPPPAPRATTVNVYATPLARWSNTQVKTSTSVQPAGADSAGLDTTVYPATGPPVLGAAQVTFTAFGPPSATAGAPIEPGAAVVIDTDRAADGVFPAIPFAVTRKVYD